jgi:hypothetical protein
MALLFNCNAVHTETIDLQRRINDKSTGAAGRKIIGK